MKCADNSEYSDVDDNDSFFDSVNELVLDAKTGQVDKKAMARKKARREASKDKTIDTSNKSKGYGMMKGSVMPAP